MGGWLWWCGIRGEGWKGGGGWVTVWVKGWRKGYGLVKGWRKGYGFVVVEFLWRKGREKRDGGLGLVLGVHDLVGEEERGSRFLWVRRGLKKSGYGGLGCRDEEEREEREKEDGVMKSEEREGKGGGVRVSEK
ncbi:uncharacterized protein G2W53_041630 [Senna tora]|uniref:Uncharacterized protein n=1 Tax=Senna tora TaxID=362788 RepID=A0A834W328_9FABA|nr:uncharacterized protein G2W53_041630 [Senna tora]